MYITISTLNDKQQYVENVLLNLAEKKPELNIVSVLLPKIEVQTFGSENDFFSQKPKKRRRKKGCFNYIFIQVATNNIGIHPELYHAIKDIFFVTQILPYTSSPNEIDQFMQRLQAESYSEVFFEYKPEYENELLKKLNQPNLSPEKRKEYETQFIAYKKKQQIINKQKNGKRQKVVLKHEIHERIRQDILDQTSEEQFDEAKFYDYLDSVLYK